jgi:hypothetical protein
LQELSLGNVPFPKQLAPKSADSLRHVADLSTSVVSIFKGPEIVVRCRRYLTSAWTPLQVRLCKVAQNLGTGSARF